MEILAGTAVLITVIVTWAELAAWYFAMKEKDGTKSENPSEK